MPFFKTRDGLSLHYTDTGTGLPLICLPGLTRCGRDFRYLAPHVRDLRLITLDFRGRGQSEYAADFMTYSVLQEAEDVIDLLDHLNLAQAAILGTSRGGMVAMTLAALHKTRLSAVILNDVGPEIPTTGLARIMEYVGHRPAAKTFERAAAQLQTAMQDAFPTVPAERWFEEVTTFYQDSDGRLELRYDPKLRDALITQAAEGPIPDLWPLYNCLAEIPLGVIRGANSDILMQDTFQKMQTTLPHAAAVEIADRGHVPFLDEPEALTLIRTTLERI